MSTIEEQAREAAVDSGLDNYKHRRHDFANGFLAAAASREELIAELVATLSQARAWIRGGRMSRRFCCQGSTLPSRKPIIANFKTP